MNRIERHQLLGEYEGRLHAYAKVIGIIRKEADKLPDDSVGKLHLRALLGDIYAVQEAATATFNDFKRSVNDDDSREDSLHANSQQENS